MLTELLYSVAYKVKEIAPFLPSWRVVTVLAGWLLFNGGVMAGWLLSRFVRSIRLREVRQQRAQVYFS